MIKIEGWELDENVKYDEHYNIKFNDGARGEAIVRGSCILIRDKNQQPPKICRPRLEIILEYLKSLDDYSLRKYMVPDELTIYHDQDEDIFVFHGGENKAGRLTSTWIDVATIELALNIYQKKE